MVRIRVRGVREVDVDLELVATMLPPEAARLLGIGERTRWTKLEKHGL